MLGGQKGDKLIRNRGGKKVAVTLVEKYNPEWPKWFEEIKAYLGEKVSRACICIEHVGSTSIPGMTAKPIIDLILVSEPQDFEEIKGLLAERGYYHQGDLGIKDREVFKLDIPELRKVKLISFIGEIDFRMSEGGDETIQLTSLLASFYQEGKKDNKK